MSEGIGGPTQALGVPASTNASPADSERLGLEDAPPTRSLAGWFLGPKAENESVMEAMLLRAFRAHCRYRRDYQPDDPPFVTDAIRRSPQYQHTIATLGRHLDRILEELRGSIPISSYRNQSHMYSDISMPAALGYFGAMLYNQNNVAAEASPVTTYLEIEVGNDLCRMLGFTVPPPDDTTAVRPWGHITCDGSVANAESMWAARNLKFYALSLAHAVRNEAILAKAKALEVARCNGARARLLDLDTWDLLNIRVDDVLALPGRFSAQYGISTATLESAMDAYLVQSIGLADFTARFMTGQVGLPQVLAPSTAHYSWRKGAALIGLGKRTVQQIHVDLDCRMDLQHLRESLDEALARHQPVLQVVAVLGTTEEGAVDPLEKIVELRDTYRARGLDFVLHVDGAWGGYFASMLRGTNDNPAEGDPDSGIPPELPMSEYVARQFRALPQVDSVTVDPHKSGFAPYPAGALCYRNGAMRSVVSFTAPVVYHGGADPTVGVYGIEGSKPGAAATGVYLSHRIIRPDANGYGELLGNCMWNSNRLYASLVTMAEPDDPFVLVPMQRLPAERAAAPAHSPGKIASIESQLQFIRRYIVPASNAEIRENPAALDLLTELGSDLIIVTYAFNFRLPDGTLNRDVKKANALNDAIFAALSVHYEVERDALHPGPVPVPTVPMIVTSSQFTADTYGESFLRAFGDRLGLSPESVARSGDDGIHFLISTTQDPWVTDTAPSPQAPDGNLLPVIVDGLRDTVLSCIATIQKDGMRTH